MLRTQVTREEFEEELDARFGRGVSGKSGAKLRNARYKSQTVAVPKESRKTRGETVNHLRVSALAFALRKNRC